jgi:CelD/BcsL family acetyltransferase involved in cellulose biosynthesis
MPVAFEFGTQWQGTYVAEETGYDRALAECSPGTVLLYRYLDDLISRDPPRRLDFGPGDGEYKRLVANRQTLSGGVLLLPHRLRSSLALVIFRSRSVVSGLLRTSLRRLGLLALFRAMYRK